MIPLLHVIIFGFSILAVGLAAVAFGVVAHRHERARKMYFSGDLPEVVLGTGVIITVVGVLISVISLVPFNGKYYPIHHRAGVVSEVSNQFVSGSGKNTAQAFVLTLDGDDTAYVLVDPRVSMLDGDPVDLACTIEWVPNGADRWNCVIGNG